MHGVRRQHCCTPCLLYTSDIEWPARVTDLLAAQLVELGLYTADEIAASKDAIVRDCIARKKMYPLVTTTLSLINI